MKQYEIWMANLPLPVGRRPVLLLSRPAAYRFLHRVTACEITSTRRGIPQEVLLGEREGLTRPCVANMDNLYAVAVRALQACIGRVDDARGPELKAALGAALGWPELLRRYLET